MDFSIRLNTCHTFVEVVLSRILIAVTGMSPAVLTETVWALTREKVPWIPDQIVAITTCTGKAEIKKLLDGGGWDRLRTNLAEKGLSVDGTLAFGATDSIRVIGDGQNDFNDIATLDQNRDAADFILRVIREYTENPKTEIVASIAGGRKTMSALMLSCMSLLGREQDRVCHVLANDTYISKNKEFLFPKNKTEEKNAQIQLSDIPFVRVRGLYEKELGEAPSSYSELVTVFRNAAPPAINYPQIVVKKMAGKVFADDEDLKLSPKEFQLVSVLAEQFLAKGKSFSWWGEVLEKVEADEEFDERWLDTRWSAVASDIRTKRLEGKPYATTLIPTAKEKSTFPPENITIEP